MVVLKILNGLIAVVGGVVGVIALFWLLNAAVERLPVKWEERLKPYVFIGPALLVVGAFLVFPTLDTIRRSFLNASSTEFVGFDNYAALFTNQALLSAIWNNVLWIIFVPTFSVAAGLAVAVLADKLRPKAESFTKSVIFLPMAISFVGASTIWGFVYDFAPVGRPQIGLLNAVWTGIGFDPVAWLQQVRINDFLLMVVMIWLQAGFAMVLLSAAIKNVPEDTIEAARIDGATESQIFWRVVVPQIRSTIVVVGTTILILVLKVFDVVRVLTNGNFNTEVVANRFITELFEFRQFGRAAVLVVALIIATIPIMILNIRKFREQEALR
jgi:alpha-glucoside transport system permease protein